MTHAKIWVSEVLVDDKKSEWLIRKTNTYHSQNDNNEDAAKLAEVHLRVATCRGTWTRLAVLFHPPQIISSQFGTRTTRSLDTYHFFLSFLRVPCSWSFNTPAEIARVYGESEICQNLIWFKDNDYNEHNEEAAMRDTFHLPYKEKLTYMSNVSHTLSCGQNTHL